MVPVKRSQNDWIQNTILMMVCLKGKFVWWLCTLVLWPCCPQMSRSDIFVFVIVLFDQITCKEGCGFNPWAWGLPVWSFQVLCVCVCESPFSPVVQLSQTVQRHAHEATWICCGCSEWWLRMAVCLWMWPRDTLSACHRYNPAFT